MFGTKHDSVAGLEAEFAAVSVGMQLLAVWTWAMQTLAESTILGDGGYQVGCCGNRAVSRCSGVECGEWA